MTPTVGVIGCGSMGTAVAELLGRRGFPVYLAGGRRRTAEGLAATIPGAVAAPLDVVAAEADLLIMATLLQVSRDEIAPRIHDRLDGKVLVDPSNPAPADLSVGRYGSAAEMLAELFPKAAVVKALNCVSARQLRTFARGGPPPTVPVAGDDLGAKWCVRHLLEQLGFDVADAGPLRNSKWIEAMAELLRRVASEEGLGDAVGFRLLRLNSTDAVPATVHESRKEQRQ